MSLVDRQKPQIILQAVMDIAHYDMHVWGTGGIGVALMQLHLNDQWATVNELTPNTALSSAQVRRRLKSLVNKGYVACRTRDDGAHCYRAVYAHAEEYLQTLCNIFALQNANPVETSESTA